MAISRLAKVLCMLQSGYSLFSNNVKEAKALTCRPVSQHCTFYKHKQFPEACAQVSSTGEGGDPPLRVCQIRRRVKGERTKELNSIEASRLASLGGGGAEGTGCPFLHAPCLYEAHYTVIAAQCGREF